MKRYKIHLKIPSLTLLIVNFIYEKSLKLGGIIMKKLYSMLLVVAMLCGMCVVPVGAYVTFEFITSPTAVNYVFAETDITVTLNGKEIQFDQPPIMVNERILVPMRAIFEAFDVYVKWDDATKTVKAFKNSKVIKFKIGDKYFLNNSQRIDLDVSAMLVNDRVLVPVCAISEALNCNVDWDDNTHTVVITSGKIDNKTQKNNLERFFKNDFENSELTVQSDMFSDIETDTNYVTAYHEIKDYSYIDIDKDGCDELIISSSSNIGKSFSIWDCDESGNVFCVLNKVGNFSRSAYRYFIAEYNGNIYVFESTGMKNSAGHQSIRNLYTYDGKRLNTEIKLYAYISYYSDSYIDESFTINGAEFDRDYVCNYINDLDTNFTTLFFQFEYML